MTENIFNCENSGRMTGDARRDFILRAAVELFSQRGFNGTTTKEIARASGVSEAMVFRHFANKEELYAAILEAKGSHDDGTKRFSWQKNEELKKAIERKDDLAVFYHLGYDALRKHRADIAFMRLLFYSALEEHTLADAFFKDFIEKIYDFIAGYIKARQKDGAFRNVKPRVAVRAFLGILIHHSLNNILWDKGQALLDISDEEAAKNFAEILLQGIKKQEA